MDSGAAVAGGQRLRAGSARCWPRQASLMLRLDSSLLPDPPAAVCSGGLTSPPSSSLGAGPRRTRARKGARSLDLGQVKPSRTPTLPDSVSLRNACFAHLPCTEAGKQAETHSAHRPGRHPAEAPPRMIVVFLSWREGRGCCVSIFVMVKYS